MIKIELAELPPVRTDGAVDMPTDTFMRLQTQWQHADVSLAIYIWTFILSQASAGRTGPWSAQDLQRETLPQDTPLTDSQVEQCMLNLVEFGLMQLSSSEPDHDNHEKTAHACQCAQDGAAQDTPDRN